MCPIVPGLVVMLVKGNIHFVVRRVPPKKMSCEGEVLNNHDSGSLDKKIRPKYSAFSSEENNLALSIKNKISKYTKILIRTV